MVLKCKPILFHLIATDECQTNPCKHGSCTKLGSRYECCCDHGYTGTHCDTGK